MADKKISALTGATTPLAGTEVLPIVQGGSTVKVSIANVTAGRAVSTGALSVVGANVTLDNAFSLVGKLAGGTSVGMMRRNSSDEVAIDEDGYGTKIGFGGRFAFAGGGNFTVGIGDVVFGTAGKGVTTSVTNGDVNITPLGTGKTILAKNGLRIPNNAAVTVGTSATQISVNAISWSSLAFVFGVDGGGNAFSDLVFYADGTTTALASRTVSGVPVTRTYTAPAGQLNLAMLSGSYSVFFQHIWTA